MREGGAREGGLSEGGWRKDGGSVRECELGMVRKRNKLNLSSSASLLYVLLTCASDRMLNPSMPPYGIGGIGGYMGV